MKTFLLTLGAIALTSSAATAADFTQYGIPIKANTYCQSTPSTMPLSVAEVKINACARQEIREESLLRSLSNLHPYKDAMPKEWETARKLTEEVVRLGRSTVELWVRKAQREAGVD